MKPKPSEIVSMERIDGDTLIVSFSDGSEVIVTAAMLFTISRPPYPAPSRPFLLKPMG
jgi:hypothetical protein